MNVLFVRPPRHYWPLMSPAGAFWQPLAFACLAAQVRRELPQAAVRIIDAPILRMGWRSLARELAQAQSDVLCLGDEAAAADEGLRLAALARQLHPHARIIAGGYFFGPMADELVGHSPIDFFVRGEGERTLVEVLRRLSLGDCRGTPCGCPQNAESAKDAGGDKPRPYERNGASRFSLNTYGCKSRRAGMAPAGELVSEGLNSSIRGAVFLDADGRVRDGGMPQLIQNLDSLPMPAWDLLPMPRYGLGSRSHRQMATLEHSRGCIDTCNFCVLWRQMGRPVDGNGRVRPCWRTKSPERSFDEVRHLYEHHGRRTFCWTDPTWNASPDWTDRFCDLLLRWGRPIEMVAWLRADGVVRDAALGILEKQVRAGLRRVMIGLERPTESELAGLGKHDCGPEVCRRALDLLAAYPQVYTIASVVFGTPDESPESLRQLARSGGAADATVFLPLTPNPGTPEWRAARDAGTLAATDFARYNFLNPLVRTRRYEVGELARLYGQVVARNTLRSVGYWLTNFRRPANRGKGGLALRLGWRAARIAAKALIGGGPVLDRRPTWYDS